jgi:thioredoxin-like negative regulator of GroEL
MTFASISKSFAATAFAAVAVASLAWAAPEKPFSAAAFEAAQSAGKPILVEVHASWCSVCRAQGPILSELTAQPKFRDLQVFRVDYDGQKEAVRRFGARSQSTLIVYKGKTEVGRSVGDTKAASIAAMLDKSL